jgi:hypothetical protein
VAIENKAEQSQENRQPNEIQVEKRRRTIHLLASTMWRKENQAGTKNRIELDTWQSQTKTHHPEEVVGDQVNIGQVDKNRRGKGDQVNIGQVDKNRRGKGDQVNIGPVDKNHRGKDDQVNIGQEDKKHRGKGRQANIGQPKVAVIIKEEVREKMKGIAPKCVSKAEGIHPVCHHGMITSRKRCRNMIREAIIVVGNCQSLHIVAIDE